MAVLLGPESRRLVFLLPPPWRVDEHTIHRTCETVKLSRLTAVRVLELASVSRSTFMAAGHSEGGSVEGNGYGSGGPLTPPPWEVTGNWIMGSRCLSEEGVVFLCLISHNLSSSLFCLSCVLVESKSLVTYVLMFLRYTGTCKIPIALRGWFIKYIY